MKKFFKLMVMFMAILVITFLLEERIGPLRSLEMQDSGSGSFMMEESMEEDMSSSKTDCKESVANGEKGEDLQSGSSASHLVQNESDENMVSIKDVLQDDSGSTESCFMTYDELISLENMSLSDKLTGMAIVKKLKSKDIIKLLDMANGGITESEYEEASRLLKETLGHDDYARLNELLMRNKMLHAEGKLKK